MIKMENYGIIVIEREITNIQNFIKRAENIKPREINTLDMNRHRLNDLRLCARALTHLPE